MKIISLAPTIIAGAADIPIIASPTTEPVCAIGGALSPRDIAGAPIGFRPPMLFASDATGNAGGAGETPPPAAAGGGDGVDGGDATAKAMEVALLLINDTKGTNPRFARSLSTPQALDRHAEGPTMQDHLTLALTMALAIGKKDLDEEELIRSLGLQDFAAEMREVFGAIRSNRPLFGAFVLAHDIAKPDTLAFAPSKAKGVDAAKLAALPEIFKPYKKPGNYKKLPNDERARIDAEERAHVAGLRAQAVASIPRLRELGSWPEWIDDETITRRVPEFGGTDAPGFDAGIASALGLIPEGKQILAAILHAAYTPQAVEQIRRKMRDLDPDSETCWWLAACSICTEGSVDQKTFLQQIQKFRELAAYPEKRLAAAHAEFEKMTRSFAFIPELGDDVPYGTEDGSTQGEYLAGHRFGVTYAESYGIYL